MDELLGVRFLDRAGEPWTVRTFPQRNATDMSAWYASVCRPLRSAPRPFRAGTVVQRTVVRFVAGVVGSGWIAPASPATSTWVGGGAPSLEVEVAGLDGQHYRIHAGWAGHTVAVRAL